MKNNQIAKNLKYIRLLKHLTQASLAKKIGVTAATIGNYERGERYIPAYLIHPLANALAVPDQFLTDTIPDNITESDIKNKASKDLLQKVVDDKIWEKKQVSQQIEVIKLLHHFFKDYYMDYIVPNNKDTPDELKSKEKIFDFFNDIDWDYIDSAFQDYEENWDLISSTAIFFFNFLVEQKKLYQDSKILKYSSFIEHWNTWWGTNSYFIDLLVVDMDEEDR